MISRFKNNLIRLQEEHSKAEENAVKKGKIAASETASIANKWFSDNENLKRWIVEKDISLNFVGVEKGKLLYSNPKICINNDGSYGYRIYEIFCKLSPTHKVFSMPPPHTEIHVSDVVDKLEFKFVKYYYDDYY